MSELRFAVEYAVYRAGRLVSWVVYQWRRTQR